MVPFAGYDMPLQYRAGLLKEHLHTRAAAGLFDVSHMGQLRLQGDQRTVARALEALMPIDIEGLAPGRQRYGVLLDDEGGILDDLMVANIGSRFSIVVNAANKQADLDHIRARLPDGVDVVLTSDALIALQGPSAEAVLAHHAPAVRDMAFMDVREIELLGARCTISRSGYTGEDGFEISCPADRATEIAEALLADPSVLPIGLGARDSLRLEAGLCLHGSDIGPDTSPVEAALTWAIQSVRRHGGARAGGFPGATRILDEIDRGAPRRRVGLAIEGRLPVRAGAPLFDANGSQPVGIVTSGGFGPSLQAPVAMGYVPAALASLGTALRGEVRGQRVALTVCRLPFVPARFKRGAA